MFLQLEWNAQNWSHLKLHKEAIVISEAQIWLYLLGPWNLKVCSCCFTCYQALFSKRTAVYLSSIFSAQLHKNSSVAFLPITSFHCSINYWKGRSWILYSEVSKSRLWPLCSGTERFLHSLLGSFFFFFKFTCRYGGENKIGKKSLVKAETRLTLYWLHSEVAEFRWIWTLQLLSLAFLLFGRCRSRCSEKKRRKKEKEPNCKESRLLERLLNRSLHS